MTVCVRLQDGIKEVVCPCLNIPTINQPLACVLGGVPVEVQHILVPLLIASTGLIKGGGHRTNFYHLGNKGELPCGAFGDMVTRHQLSS